MKFLIDKKNIVSWITIIILTNCLTLYLVTSSIIKLPNTVVLTNESSQFLNQLIKVNQLDRLIQLKYTGEIDNQVIGDSLLYALFDALGDPYSEYFSSQEFEQINNSYSETFGGVGIVFNTSDSDNLVITQIIENSPAEAAGIMENDKIIAVDGENVVGQSSDVIVSKTRGEVGTNVTITVERNGEQIDFNLTRSKIDNNTIYSEIINNIGYIYITSFGNGTAGQFEKEVTQLIRDGVSGLVIDLRDNGGGIVDSAVEVADILLDSELIGYSLDKNGKQLDYTTKNGKIDIPFVVLVNKNTASASELLAGALQKSGITLIGNTTFGKGVMQEMAELTDGSGYKLTFREYYLNDGTAVNKVGITPDIIVDYPENPENITSLEEDPQIQAALEAINNKIQGN